MPRQRKSLTPEQKASLEQSDARAKLAWFGSILRQMSHDSIGKARQYPHSSFAQDVIASRALGALLDAAKPDQSGKWKF